MKLALKLILQINIDCLILVLYRLAHQQFRYAQPLHIYTENNLLIRTHGHTLLIDIMKEETPDGKKYQVIHPHLFIQSVLFSCV